jgi:hypothetical protein
MMMLDKLGIRSDRHSIDWDLTPADTFGLFESWGGKERIRNKNERFYYFFIADWAQPAALYLMERGIKHARLLARINAPQDMIDACMASQGKSSTLDKSYAINPTIRRWLEEEVLDSFDPVTVIPIAVETEEMPVDCGLAPPDTLIPGLQPVRLRSVPRPIEDHEIGSLIKQGNFYDSRHHRTGSFANYFVDNGDNLTVTDKSANLMWMRRGCDINSIRTIIRWIDRLNRDSFGGYNDWRLPTIEEGLTLLEKNRNDRGLYLNPCFSAGQPFIFTADRRQPGGHWFVDFTQARVYWGSAFNPGGFGRVCRNA